jgi:hypothetical protein
VSDHTHISPYIVHLSDVMSYICVVGADTLLLGQPRNLYFYRKDDSHGKRIPQLKMDFMFKQLFGHKTC